MKFEFSGVLVKKGGKILLVRERHRRAKNLWSLPLGFVEKGETLKEGAIREAKEESGYNVQALKKIKSIIVSARDFRSAHPSLKGNRKARLTIFSAEIIGKQPQKHYLKSRWFSKTEIKKLPLRGEWEKSFLIDS